MIPLELAWRQLGTCLLCEAQSAVLGWLCGADDLRILRANRDQVCAHLVVGGLDFRRRLTLAGTGYEDLVARVRPLPRGRVVLVSCSSSKRRTREPVPAAELYTSPLFREAWRHTEGAEARYILSAKHGLVDPTQRLGWYDERLGGGQRAREAWAERVFAQIEETGLLGTGLLWEFHAGAAYTTALRQRLERLGEDVWEPLQGLPVGERQRFYRLIRQGRPLSAERILAGAPDPVLPLDGQLQGKLPLDGRDPAVVCRGLRLVR